MCVLGGGSEEDGQDGSSVATEGSRTSEEEWRNVGDEMQYALAQSHSWTSKQTHINTLVSSAKSITTAPPTRPHQNNKEIILFSR